MKKLVFVTQKVDPDDPVLGATVPMLRALAARVDELVVVADSAVDGSVDARVRVFGSPSRARRLGAFERALGRELRPRPDAVVAHMVPLYVLAAAPLVRPLGIPLVLWYTHWADHTVLRAAEKVSTAVVSVDRSSFPFETPKLRPIGHGIDVSEFTCRERESTFGPLRAVVVGRYAPTKGLDEIVRGFRIARDSGLDARLELRGATGSVAEEQQKGRLVALAGDDVEVGGPLPHGELPALFARSDLLINNHRAADKVVYEAAASCLPVLASAEAFAELLPDELRFHGAEQLAERLLALDRRRRPELRAAVEARHSVDHWADQLLAAVR